MAWLLSCTLRTRARQTCVSCFCNMAQTSTATSMSTATLLSCSQGYPVCLSTSWSFASLNTEPALRSFYSSLFNIHCHPFCFREDGYHLDDVGRWSRDRCGELGGQNSSTNGCFCRCAHEAINTRTLTPLPFLPPTVVFKRYDGEAGAQAASYFRI